MDASDTKSEDHASAPAESRPVHDAPGKPEWSRQINRVQGSVWRHEHNGKTFFSVSFSRSHFDEREKKWKRYHSFNWSELDDLVTLCREAQDHIRELRGITQVVGED